MILPLNDSVSRRKRFDALKLSSFLVFVLVPLFWWGETSWGENTAGSALALYVPQYFYLIGPLLLGIGALFQRRFRLVWLNGAMLLFCLFFPLGWHFHLPTSSSAPTIRIVTFNVQRGEGNLEQVTTSLHALRPDVICLQETGRTHQLALNGVGRDVAHAFPGWNAHFAGDVTTLSRFPVEREHVYPLPGTRRTLETVVRTPRGKLRVLNTHVSTSFKGNRSPQSKSDHLAVLWETARPSAQIRLDQLPLLRQAIESGDTKTPLVLVGDFNTPPRGHFYEGLKTLLKDTFAEVGNGTGYSFPSRFPLLRIDYVWARGVKARSAFVGEASGSDHRPLVTDIGVGA